MSWTFNNKTAEQLGITVAGWSENTLNASAMNLNTVVEDFTADVPSELAFNNAVTVRWDGQQVFKGLVRRTPRSARGVSESLGYTILDAFDTLDRTPYMESRLYADSVTTTEESKITNHVARFTGTVFFDRDESIGARITKVIDYAASVGVDVAVGQIDAALTYERSEYKDQACGSLIRDMMRLIPEYVFYIDNRQSVPTANVRLRSDLTALNVDVAGGDVVLTSDVLELESDRVNGVVIQYEIPVSIDGDNSTFLVKDVAGEERGPDVVVQTVAIDASSFTNEYQRVVTRPVPQVDDDNATKLDFWIDQVPELASLANDFGKETLLGLLVVAEADEAGDGVKGHSVKVVDDGLDTPDPINPNDNPLAGAKDEDTDDAADYPRMIVSGAIPEWSTRRKAVLMLTATIGIEQGELDSADEEIRVRLEEVFSLAKSFGDNDYMTATFVGNVDGTNAQTKNYRRQISSDLNELPELGIAEQLLAQYNEARFTGSMRLKGVESMLNATLAKRVNITGGRSEWASMNEAIQRLDFDVDLEEVRVSFGPPAQLGANDLRDRLRALEINRYSHNQRSDEEIEEGVGGAISTAATNFSRIGGGGGAQVCVLGSLRGDPDAPGRFKLLAGSLKFGGSTMDVEKGGISPIANGYLYVEASVTGDEIDDVLQPGGTLNAVDVLTGSSVPSDVIPVVENLAGKAYIQIGKWDADLAFQPAGCGSLSLGFCPPDFRHWRT